MSCRNEALEAAFDELQKHNVMYRTQETRDRHVQIFISGSPMIVTVSGSKKDRDNIIAKKVRADIRRSISKIKG